MTRTFRPHPLRFLLAPTMLLAVAACDQAAPEPMAEPPLEGATIGGPFELTSENGQIVRWDDFDGQYRIVYFGYAYCPDVCPTDTQRTMQGLRQFAEEQPELAGKIQPIFVSIDPERDTPEVLAEFTDSFHPDLLGLTGTPEQVEAAADNFRIFFARGEEGDEDGYLLDHVNVTYLFGPAGDPIATLPTDLGPDAIQAELAKWVR